MFELDERLQRDCIVLRQLTFSRLLLLNNASVPWFILVPNTDKTEFHHLTHAEQLQLLDEINRVSTFVEATFSPTKLNIGAIGNIVRQMHIHIVARQQNDACWPNVVWGNLKANPYPSNRLDDIKLSVHEFFAHAK